ncbi:hypothetical protein [Mesorhizobium sp.]|uniref:hypothetical protein n=1 Tax=Mesorhizobium sp. TaxID=1871066 RepID=UPI000FE738C5|nr:hypothetical protein [Mesorhizobium sp.]RWO21743.1 MAG: hypothetical protein EOS09_22305 [Mesorhizobium sp.]
MNDLARKAAKAAADFYDAQKAHCAEYRKHVECKHTEAAQNPFAMQLRARLLAIYETDTIPEAIRLQAWALQRAAEAYVSKRLTGWPMFETDLRPEFPEVCEHRGSTDEDQERRAGWLYRTDEWVCRVEASHSVDI